MGSQRREAGWTRRDFLSASIRGGTAAAIAVPGWWALSQIGAPAESAPQKSAPSRRAPPEKKETERSEGPKYGITVSFQVKIDTEPRYWYVKDIAGARHGPEEGRPLFPGECAFTGISERKQDFNGTAIVTLKTMSPQDAWDTVCARAGFNKPLIIQLANHARVSPWSVFALAFQESRAFPGRRSKVGKYYDEGLLQLNTNPSHGPKYFRGFLQQLALIHAMGRGQQAWADGAWKLVTGKDHAGELPQIARNPARAVTFASREYDALNPNQNVASGLWLVGDDLGRIEARLGRGLSFTERSRLMLTTLYTGVTGTMLSAFEGAGNPLPFETVKTKYFAGLEKSAKASVFKRKKFVVGERDFLYRLMMEYLTVMTGCLPVDRCGILRQATAKAQ